MAEFRQGDLVRAKNGPHQGKIGRICGVTETLPDFIGDRSYVYLGVCGEWAPEIPKEKQIPGIVAYLPGEIEHYVA